jgi:hypothetical protein
MGHSAKVMDTATIVASAAERLAQYCPDLANWPRSWSVEPRDVPAGQQLVECFTPFLLSLLDRGLSRKTLRNHRDNLWVLGGEMIRAYYDNPNTRKLTVQTWLDEAISEDGGPLMYHCDSEDEQRSFDSTCRRYHRFRQETGQSKLR